MSIESVMPSSHLILCCPLLLLPPVSPSIRVFSNESTLRMRWPKYWSFSYSISPSKEHPGLISFRMDLLDIFAVQGTLKSFLQHHWFSPWGADALWQSTCLRSHPLTLPSPWQRSHCCVSWQFGRGRKAWCELESPFLVIEQKKIKEKRNWF